MYKEIKELTKMEVLKEFWRCGNLSMVANKYGVNRASIYKWKEIAEKSMLENLKELTPGKRHVTVEQQNNKLKEQVKNLLDILHKERKEIFMPVVFCPECKSDKVRKNGKVITREKGLRQRYICNKCSASIYVALKKLPDMRL